MAVNVVGDLVERNNHGVDSGGSGGEISAQQNTCAILERSWLIDVVRTAAAAAPELPCRAPSIT